MNEIELLKKLIENRSVSGNPEALNRAAEIVRAELEQNGVWSTFESVGDYRVLYASSVPGEKCPDVLLCVHLDVVPGEETQFCPEVRDGILYGRGANDDLGNAVAAIRILVESKGKYSIGCIFSADEETGGTTTCAMVERGYSAKRAGLVLDSWANGNIVWAHKGMMSVKVTAHGRGGHASAPWSFENPVEAITDAAVKLRTAWENPKSEDDWRVSMTPTVLAGGNMHNRIPDEASLVLNIRTVVAEDADRMMKFIRERTGLDDVCVLEQCDPFNGMRDTDIAKKLCESSENSFGLPAGLIREVGATDARYIQKTGVPVYILGVAGAGCHSSNETLELSSVGKLVAAVLSFAGKL